MAKSQYIHGTTPSEQERLALLNRLTNPPFIAWLGHFQGKKILEVGSGLGILAGEIATAHPSCEVVGLEYSADQLAKAPSHITNLTFVQGDALDMPFEAESFDVVYCRYVLEHVSNPSQMLQEMYRVLKKGGQVFTQENDVEVIQFDPPCPTFKYVWQQFIQLQKQLGGDALIGRKLYRLLQEAHFKNINLSLAPQVHGFGDKEFKGWVHNIIGNVESGREKLVKLGFVTESEIDKSIQELEQLKHNEQGSTVFYWNRAKGMK